VHQTPMIRSVIAKSFRNTAIVDTEQLSLKCYFTNLRLKLKDFIHFLTIQL
jgi:hypothetical protein